MMQLAAHKYGGLYWPPNPHLHQQHVKARQRWRAVPLQRPRPPAQKLSVLGYPGRVAANAVDPGVPHLRCDLQPVLGE